MERERPETNNLWSILGISLLSVIATGAFSWKSKQIIKQRDGNKSVLSGETEDLEAAHINHARNERYDDPSNGRLLTTEEHLRDHINRAGRNGLTKAQNNWAIAMLKKKLGIED